MASRTLWRGWLPPPLLPALLLLLGAPLSAAWAPAALRPLAPHAVHATPAARPTPALLPRRLDPPPTPLGLAAPVTAAVPPAAAFAPPPASPSFGGPPAPAWVELVTPGAMALLGGLALGRMAATHQWPPAGPSRPPTALHAAMRGGGYGGPKPSLWKRFVFKTKSFGKWIVRTAKRFVRWVRTSPIDVVMLSIFLCSWALWINPALERVFLVQGFKHPLAFLFSGFSCFNIYQLYSDIFYVYILGKAYCVEFSPKELALLYGGGTFAGSLLVALTPGGWMGPTAGTAALLTAFMLRYPGTPMAIPMIPLIFFPFQVRWIGTALAVFNFYLFTKGVAAGAAFTGGVLFALLLKPRRELVVQDVPLS